MNKKQTQQQNNKVRMWDLFLTFFKIGAFTFGGGYAMISIVEREVVERKKWITADQMLDMLVIAESTPGVIAVNTATSVGYRSRGIFGAIVATLGVVLPSFFIILGLSFAIDALKDNTWYKAAFKGVQVCVVLLILNAFIKLFKQLQKNVVAYILMVGAFTVSLLTNFNVIFVILIGAAVGIICRLISDRNKNNKLPAEIIAEEQENSEEE
ncbi:MAG: chromate transporter [Corallococcus sp.]|nr:chromate transporter [Corallococcus sp.]